MRTINWTGAHAATVNAWTQNHQPRNGPATRKISGRRNQCAGKPDEGQVIGPDARGTRSAVQARTGLSSTPRALSLILFSSTILLQHYLSPALSAIQTSCSSANRMAYPVTEPNAPRISAVTDYLSSLRTRGMTLTIDILPEDVFHSRSAINEI